MNAVSAPYLSHHRVPRPQFPKCTGIPAIRKHLSQKLAYLCLHWFSGPFDLKWRFWDKIGEVVVRCWPPPANTSYFWGCYLCAAFGGNRSTNATLRVCVSPISPIWRLNGCQMITVNSGVSWPKSTKFLCNVERTSAVLIRPSSFPFCHPLWNACPMK